MDRRQEVSENIKIELIKEVKKGPCVRYNLWSINDRKVYLKSKTYDLHALKLLIKEVEEHLIKGIYFKDLLKNHSYILLMFIQINLFPKLFEKYLHAAAGKVAKEDELLKKALLLNFIYGKSYIPKTLRGANLINQVITHINMERLSVFLEAKNIKNKWSIVLVKQYQGRIAWKINGHEISFMGTIYFDSRVVQLTLNEIEYYLKNKLPLKKLLKIYNNIRLISNISALIFPSLFKGYLITAAEQFTFRREVVTFKKLNKKVFLTENTASFCNEYKDIVRKVIINEYKEQCDLFLRQNNNFDFNKDRWIFYYLEGNSLNTRVFNFLRIKKSSIRGEIKSYFAYKLKSNKYYSYDKQGQNFQEILSGINYITLNDENVNCCADINIFHVRDMFTHFETENHYSAGSLIDIKSAFNSLFDWLIENAHLINTPTPSVNCFEKISFHNAKNMQENAKYIPEEVIEKLLYHIDDLKPVFQRMLLIMLNCGLHFSDVVHLTEDCLIRPKKDGDKYILKYIPWKTRKSRRIAGMEDYHRIVIHESVASEVMKQIKETERLRKESGMKEVFIHRYNKIKIKSYVSKAFNTALNKLIKQRNITADGINLWRFTSRQCRKTLAVDMVMNNAQPGEIGNLLAHASSYTTARYYAEVRKMVLADLNSKFWEKEFNVVMEKKEIEKFTLEERKILYLEFKLGVREVELGYCMKEYGEEPCNKRTGRINCATCSRLCVSIQKIDKWKSLKDNQEERVRNLEKQYEALGVTDFRNYREFQREMYLFDAYSSVVDRILNK